LERTPQIRHEAKGRDQLPRFQLKRPRRVYLATCPAINEGQEVRLFGEVIGNP
jgi:hypothetical protein